MTRSTTVLMLVWGLSLGILVGMGCVSADIDTHHKRGQCCDHDCAEGPETEDE